MEKDILPLHCNRQCPTVSCRALLQQLVDEVRVTEIDGELRAYPTNPNSHANASSNFVQRLAVCVERQRLYTGMDGSITNRHAG